MRPLPSVTLFGRRSPRVIAGCTVLALIAAGAVVLTYTHIEDGPTHTFRADFAETPGLYVNNAVDILGVPTGTVTSVKAHAGYVEVTMSLPAHVKVPAQAHAIMMAPNPVSDRTVELYPPYTSGPVMPSGAVIPIQRTSAPLGVDQIFNEVDSLAKALGPSGANKNGALSSVVSSLAKLTGSNGQNLKDTLAALASALPAFTSDPSQLSDLITSLDKLSQLLAQHNASIDALFSDLTTAGGQLATERQTLASAISNLQDGLAQIAQFLKTNQSNLSTTMSQLATTSTALVKDQKALITTFSTAALGFQNVNNIIDVNAPCTTGDTKSRCPVAFGRLDFPQNIQSVVQTYCPGLINSVTPILLSNVPGLSAVPGLGGVADATTINTLCLGEVGLQQGHNGSPGAPTTPDLDLAKYLK